MPAGRGTHNSRVRRVSLAALDAALLRGLFAGWSYRCGLQGKLRVSEYEIRLARSKPLPGPLRLAFASDFHAGPTTDPIMFATLSDEIIRQQPDVLLLGGDYVSFSAEYVNVLCEELSRCKPPLGTYGVLGNHDLWTDEEHIMGHLTGAGVNVLINRNCPLAPPYDCVSICGIDDPWTGRAEAAEAFRTAGSIRIFLSHSPDGLLLLGTEQYDLGLAGHTHGGQVALPDGTPIIGAGGPLSRKYGRGRFEIEGNGPLIVSRGVGCSNLPIRINSDPELIICTLLSQPDTG